MVLERAYNTISVEKKEKELIIQSINVYARGYVKFFFELMHKHFSINLFKLFFKCSLNMKCGILLNDKLIVVGG